MDMAVFRDYREKVYQYRYKFFLLAVGGDGSFGMHQLKGLEYRFRAEKKTPDLGVVEEGIDTVGEIMMVFPFKIDVLLPEAAIKWELDNYVKHVVSTCKEIKDDEVLRRANLSSDQIFKSPPGIWDFKKKVDSDPESAEKTFREWDRLLEAYRLSQEGKTPSEILGLMFDTYLPYSDQPNRIRKLKNDLEKAQKLADSALHGSFPFFE
jgi:hypothetical protein